jgi:xanthine dehydrogenase small subunit
MAPTPKRATRVETLLRGRRFDLDTMSTAAAALTEDFQPISDCRGSAEYRTRVAQNLLARLYWQVTARTAPIGIEELTA